MTSTLTVEQIDSLRAFLHSAASTAPQLMLGHDAINQLCDMALSSAGGTREQTVQCPECQEWFIVKVDPDPAPVLEEKSIAVVNDDGEVVGEVVVSGADPVHAAPSAVEEVETKWAESQTKWKEDRFVSNDMHNLALDLARRLGEALENIKKMGHAYAIEIEARQSAEAALGIATKKNIEAVRQIQTSEAALTRARELLREALRVQTDRREVWSIKYLSGLCERIQKELGERG